jgi:hypothetical protein
MIANQALCHWSHTSNPIAFFLKRQKKENLRGGAQNGEKLNKASRVPGRKEEQYFQVLLHSKVTTVNNNTLYISKLLKE